MKIHSLGYRTDFFLVAFDGNVRDRGDYLFLETPTNPSFHWGNLLFFPKAPEPGDFERWTALYKREFAHAPAVNHVTLAWDSEDWGNLDPFLKAGYKQEKNLTLVAEKVKPPERPNTDIVIRPIAGEAEWEAVIDGHVLARDPSHAREGYERFTRRQTARYRGMIEAGWGNWYGAFLGDRLAGDLGLFVREGIGRYQLVSTHPDFQRRGICGTLVHHVAELGFHEMGAKTLVLLADENYRAARIYESVGFRVLEKLRGLSYSPRLR